MTFFAEFKLLSKVELGLDEVVSNVFLAILQCPRDHFSTGSREGDSKVLHGSHFCHVT